jgi:hypothetical protein
MALGGRASQLRWRSFQKFAEEKVDDHKSEKEVNDGVTCLMDGVEWQQEHQVDAAFARKYFTPGQADGQR